MLDRPEEIKELTKEPTERMLIHPDSFNNYVNRLKIQRKKKDEQNTNLDKRPGSGNLFKTGSGKAKLVQGIPHSNNRTDQRIRAMSPENIVRTALQNKEDVPVRDTFYDETPNYREKIIEMTKDKGVKLPKKMLYEEAVDYLAKELRRLDI